jgi:acetyl esterase
MAPYLDPVNQAFVDAGSKAGGPPLYELSYVDARAALEDIQAHESASDVVTTEFDVETPASPTGKVKTVLYRPAGSERAVLPTIFYTHGGGWILGR